MNFAEIKKFLIFDLIGCLIVAALIAIGVVLFGEFNEVTGKVFFTLFVAIIHSLVSLAFVWDESGKGLYDMRFFVNTLFILIIASFVTSIFGIWEIIPSDYIWRVYQTYLYIAIGALHGNVLSKAMGKTGYMDKIISSNYVFIVAVILMLQPIIFTKNAMQVLPEMNFRLLGALAIIDATLSILTIIFYRLYTNKHPEVKNESSSFEGLGIWVLILGVFLAWQFIYILSSFFGRY